MDTLATKNINPIINSALSWKDFSTFQAALEQQILPQYLPKCRWFRSKTKTIASAATHHYPVIRAKEQSLDAIEAYPLRIQVSYTNGTQEGYFLPIALITEPSKVIYYSQQLPQAILCEVKNDETEGIIIDALFDGTFQKALFELLCDGTNLFDSTGGLNFETGKALSRYELPKDGITSKVLGVEQTNTSIVYNDTFFLKIYRKLENGINPELELVRFLSEKTNFQNAPQYGGSILFEQDGKAPVVVGMMQNKIENEGDAWSTMLKDLQAYYDRVLALKDAPLPKLINKERLYFMDVPKSMRELISRTTYKRIIKLAERTAEMHIALNSAEEDEALTPEYLTLDVQTNLCKSHLALVEDKLGDLEKKLDTFPSLIAQEVKQVIAKKAAISNYLQNLTHQPIKATQTRVHGDYHLGQVLDNGNDFFIIDFEGEPMRSIEERRLKTTPFKDVAGMIRSFHYAAYGQLYLHPEDYPENNLRLLEQWAYYWFHYASQFFLTAYLDRTENQRFIPQDKNNLALLLRTFIMEKAIYEVGYEMNARPDWLRIPLRGLLHEIRDL